MGTLAVRLTLPPVGRVEDFHLQVGAPCRAHQKKGTESLFPTRSLLNQMVLKALRIVAIGRKSSSALSGKGMKPN
jgi:hypothetical protein